MYNEFLSELHATILVTTHSNPLQTAAMLLSKQQ
jgi:hypothetical protein